MKRTLKTLMILVMAMLLMTGCGNDKSEESNVTSDANTDINADANEVGGTFNTGKDYPIDIKDIDWRVVYPPCAAALQPVSIVSFCSCPGSLKCTCISINPGMT